MGWVFRITLIASVGFALFFYRSTRPIEVEGLFEPSHFSRMLAVVSSTDYDPTPLKKTYKGSKKILVLCAEEKGMPVVGGRKFSTGNHPVELSLPILHFRKAGFDVQIATPTGSAVAIEEWALPKKDKYVLNVLSELKQQLQNPIAYKDVSSLDGYAALFLPGGHGAMQALNSDLGKLLRSAAQQEMHVITICHGPAMLLAAKKEGNDSFPFAGFEMAVFPDFFDFHVAPRIGYLPGRLLWQHGERLKKAGAKIVNENAFMPTGVVHRDRFLFSGDSPAAANLLGKVSASSLLEKFAKD